MLAQQLRHRVTLQEQVVTQATNGAKSEGWVTRLEHEPAAILALSGREFTTANNEFGVITHRITLRYQGLAIKAQTWRVIDETDGTVYNIKAPLPDFKLRQYVNLMCESGLNNG